MGEVDQVELQALNVAGAGPSRLLRERPDEDAAPQDLNDERNDQGGPLAPPHPGSIHSPAPLHSSPSTTQAQPQLPTDEDSSGGAGETPATNSSRSAQHPGNPADASRRSSQASTLVGSLRSWAYAASSALSLDQITPYSGVSVEVQASGGDRIWHIKVTKLGRWIVLFHAALAAFGTFNVATSVYALISSLTADRVQERILKSVLRSSAQLEGMEQKFQSWVDEAATGVSDRREQLRAEQRLWEALIKIFEDCPRQSDPGNATYACTEARQYFEDHPLPKVDKSPLAKRSLAKIDVLIRQHLQLKPGESGSDAWSGQRLLKALAIVSAVCISVVGAILLYLALRRWRPILRRNARYFSRKALFGHGKLRSVVLNSDDEKHAPNVAYSSGGDTGLRYESVTFRGPKLPSAHNLAAKGAWERLADVPDLQMQLNKVDAANEYGSLLTAAARSGDLQTLNYVLSRGARMDVVGGRYHNPLQAAAHSGNNAVVERLLHANASDISIGGFYGSSVHAAAEKGDSSMLQTLLASPNVANNINELGGTFGTPLMAAAAKGDQDSVSMLLARLADVSKAKADGTTALHLAAANGHLGIVSMLHGVGCDLDVLSTAHGSPLHAACSASRAEVATLLVRLGANPLIKNIRLQTPLHAAVGAPGGMHDIVCAMLDTEPRVINQRDSDGQTALHLASIKGDLGLVKILLARGADAAMGDKFNAQPLFRAAGCGHAEVVHALLDIGHADPNASDCFGRTALHGPAQTTDVRVHRYLLDYGANVNAIGNDQKTALHEACNMGRIENVKLLLERDGVLVNELDNDQFPPLYKALCSSDAHPDYLGKCVEPKVLDVLLKRRDIDVNVSAGIAVQEAARKGMLHVVKEMLERRGADLQVRGGKYGGVLQAAAISGHLALVSMLLEPRHQIDINQPGGELGCPLSAAAAYGHNDIVHKLLEAGADARGTGAGRYGSPMQSVCQKLKEKATYGWNVKSMLISELIKEYGGEEALRPVEKPYAERSRWLITPAGWAWAPPGEM